MTLQEAILLGIKASIVLTVFALGLETTIQEITYLFRHPAKLVRSLVAMDVVMPILVVLLIAVTSLPEPVRIALAALSVSPVPPALPKKTTQAGGTEEYTVGLLVAAAVIAIVFVPLSIALLGSIAGVAARVPFATVALLMATTILGPLAAGAFVRGLVPAVAKRIAKPLTQTAGIALVLCALPVLLIAAPQMWELVHDGTLMAFSAFVLAGLAVGHFLGGPERDDRTVLAIATASRHPGMAIAIAAASFPAQKLVVPAIILYLLVSMAASFPYVFLRRSRVASRSTAKR
jgi:BASS family bile acid:Na+ symporter